MKYEVYTDGSLDPGTRVGAYAFILVKDGEKLSETVVKVKRTDSDIMEITAAIKGLELIPDGAQVTVFSDSRVLIDMMVLDIHRWKKVNWQRRSGRTVKNRDLFMELDRLSTTRKVTWKWSAAIQEMFITNAAINSAARRVKVNRAIKSKKSWSANCTI